MFEHMGVKIDIDQSGHFIASIGDVAINKRTLSEAQEAIQKETAAQAKRQTLELAAVGLLHVGTGWGTAANVVGRTKITGVNRTTRNLQCTDTPKGYEWRTVLPFSEANEKLLADWIASQKETERLWKMVRERSISASGSGRIEAEEYGDILKKVQASYDAAAAKYVLR